MSGVGRDVEAGGAPLAAGSGAWAVEAPRPDGVTVAERAALGTTARLVLWRRADPGAALRAVDRTLQDLDHQVSRFRTDSELSRAERRAPSPVVLSPGAADALVIALGAACATGGLVDPTVGAALCALGYDRDFAAIDPAPGPVPAQPAPGWRAVHLSGRELRLPAGVRLDLGATAKGLGADRAARAAAVATGPATGVLVSLGGDVAVAGRVPGGGWPVVVAEDPAGTEAPGGEVVRLARGGVATSSTMHRRWRRGEVVVHHVVDPATGQPVDGPWRTATVAARTCVEANAAATAALVAGGAAEGWLARHGLPARLVAVDGSVRRVGGWPAGEATPLEPPRRSIFEPGARAGGPA